MSDLVERLRDAAVVKSFGVLPSRKLYAEAADRIEELEVALREIAKDDDGPITMAKIARAALAPEQNK